MKRPDAFDLLTEWESFAASLAQGYDLGLDDYLNDVDARQMLDTIVNTEKLAEDGAFRSRLAAADAQVRDATTASKYCIWGAVNESDNGWTRDSNWRYYAVPKVRSEEFDEDLGGDAANAN